MKTLAAIIGAGLLASFATPAAATRTDLPACNNVEVQQALHEALPKPRLLGTKILPAMAKDMQSRGDKRWCITVAGIGNSFVEVVYTLEWIDEGAGRWWLGVQSQRRVFACWEKPGVSVGPCP